MSLDSAIHHLLAAKRISAASQSYAKDNQIEAQKVFAYLNGGARPTGVTTEMGLGLLEVEDARRAATPPPPPPPPSSAYFNENWSTGRFESVRWDRLHSYGSPGWLDIPSGGVAATPDGRVAVVNDPAGSGKKCARLEIRDSDPGYAVDPNIDKSEIVSNATFKSGDVRWFEWDIYCPYTASEKFEWAHGGSQPFFSMMGFHPPGPTGWSAFILGWEAFQFNSGGDSYQDKNVHLNIRIEGGTFPEDTYSKFYKLVRLTDANGNRDLANHNRWIKLVWGLRLAPDNSGWFEAYADGALVVPRESRPTMWAGHDGMYFKYGLYGRHDASFPESGRSVAYFGRTAIGADRPF